MVETGTRKKNCTFAKKKLKRFKVHCSKANDKLKEKEVEVER